MAKGYHQRQGVDNDETFSPIVLLTSIRILLVIAAHYNYEIWKMDVKIAFFNGNLYEDVYMTQPEDFTSKDGSKVCKIQKSIYGLKQKSKSWNIRFVRQSKNLVSQKIKMRLVCITRLMGVLLCSLCLM